MEDKTSMYSVEEFNDAYVETLLVDIYDALVDRGYNASSQIVGYLMSGDPGYISSYQDSRKKITSIDRSLILEFLLKKALGEYRWDI